VPTIRTRGRLAETVQASLESGFFNL